MGKLSGLGSTRKHPRSAGTSGQTGFTLLEVLLAGLLVLVAVVSLLHSVTLALQSFQRAHTNWKVALEAWNRVQSARAETIRKGEKVQLLPQSRPLYQLLIKPDSEDQQPTWEVWHAEF